MEPRADILDKSPVMLAFLHCRGDMRGMSNLAWGALMP